jgi:type IV pilus assembly protein PilO
MAGFETGLENKPWYYSAIAGLVMGAVIVGVGYYLIFTDLQGQIIARQNELTELQKQIDEGRAAERSLAQFREEVNRLQLDLDKLLKVLPTRMNTEDLLRRLRTLTEQGDFKLLRFAPSSRSQQQFYYEWPIQITLDGTYHNLARFFDRISRFSRIINIENLRVTARPADPVRTIGATFTMKTFIYIEPAKAEEGKGKV